MAALSLLRLLLLVQATTICASNNDNDSSNGGRSLRGNDEAQESIEQEHRHLLGASSSPVIAMLESGEGAITVKIRQSIIGDPENCAGSAKARFFAMIYKDVDTLEETCSFERNADACFERTVVLPCDPETFMASIDVYVVLDRSGTLLGKQTVTNPNVGLCLPPEMVDRFDAIPRPVKHTRTFQCTDPNKRHPEP